MENKIKSESALRKIIASLKKRGKTVVFTNGCFDILHRGHIMFLKKAKSLGDVLIVAVNSDRSVKRIKGPLRPINSQKDRALVLSFLELVDYVTIFDELDPGDLIKKIRPDILIKGGDWKKDKIVGGDFVASRGGRVYSIPLEKGYSTTQLITNIVKRPK